jgi:hypothetical protein
MPLVTIVFPLLLVIAGSRPAAAQPGCIANTHPTCSIRIMVGQVPFLTPMAPLTPAGTVLAWYLYDIVPGRSYCVEAVAADAGDWGSPTSPANVIEYPIILDPALTVFGADTVGVLAVGDDGVGEPPAAGNGRACYIPTAPGPNYGAVRNEPHALEGAGQPWRQFRVRVVETTLFSDWFYVGADYSAYTLIRNSMDSGLNYVVNWRNAGGAVVATTGMLPLAGNGTMFFDARSFAGALAVGHGSVEIAHTGPPGAISASTTVLSATTGLSFDAPFTARPTW